MNSSIVVTKKAGTLRGRTLRLHLLQMHWESRVAEFFGNVPRVDKVRFASICVALSYSPKGLDDLARGLFLICAKRRLIRMVFAPQGAGGLSRAFRICLANVTK